MRIDHQTLVRLARALDLTSRVGAHVPKETLVAQLGSTAQVFLSARRRTAAAEIQHLQTCRYLQTVADGIDTKVVYLKGAALLLLGKVRAGARSMVDLDVLVAPEDAARLQQRLLVDGWREMDVPPCEHQLRPLTREGDSTLELHIHLPGVRLEEGASASLCELDRLGLVQTPREGLTVPSTDVLIAHALVHGIAQHGSSPESYPPLRMLCDLEALGFDRTKATTLIAQHWSWLTRELTQEEVLGLATLLERLAERGAKGVLLGDDTAAMLLRHMVAGSLDPRYALSLRFAALLDPPTERSRLGWLIRTAASAVWLTRGQLETRYGKPKSELGYLFHRLRRPFELAAQLGRAVAAHLARDRH
ncbi:MAG: nucleotidyltransferase family protein [Myxococcales bacterium]|nr:nucleotidyltransferase family protein [Myxococcales bacterium]